MSENKSEYEIREENRIRNEEWARKVLGYPSIAEEERAKLNRHIKNMNGEPNISLPEPNKNSNRLDNWDKSTLKPDSFLKEPTPQTKERIKTNISNEIQTADVKIDPKEGKKFAKALKEKDLKQAAETINSINLNDVRDSETIQKMDQSLTRALEQAGQKMSTENTEEVKNIFQSHKEM